MRITLAQAELRAGALRCDPAIAHLAADLRQRIALLDAVLADLLSAQAIRRLGLLPEPLLQHHPALRPASGAEGPSLSVYAAELVLCPDGAWRSRAERTAAAANHGMAALFEAPSVLPFLPGLCRALLGEALRLPSIPTLWLHDPAARAIWTADSGKWRMHHGFGRPSAGGPERRSLDDRLLWQRRLDRAPWALTASLAWCWSDLDDDAGAAN